MQQAIAQRLGPIWLAPGISRGNVITKLYASFISIGMLSGMSLLQGYVLTEHLLIPRSQQGQVTGILSVWTEIVMIVLMPLCGVLADKIGRRPMLILATLAIGLGFGLYPFATSFNELFIYRMIYAVGASASATIIATLTNDYPQGRSRGKMIGISSMMNTFGVMFVGGAIAQVPALVQSGGYDAVTGGRVMYLLCAGLCLVSTLVFHKGLKGGTPAAVRERPNYSRLATAGLRAMRNPRICLSFACAFTGRSDLVIKGMFLSLWAIHDASKWGMSPGQAMARFGLILVAMQFVAVIWQPSFGWIMDKVNRVTAMIIAMFFASTGYLSMVFVTSPLDYTMFPFFIILTLGSGSAIMASIGLVGQEAERKERAAVIGVNGMFGALGILVFSYFGGIWFDEWRPAGPFIVVGALQGVLLVVAAIVRIVAPGKQETG
ncbi:MAG: MFS transporter [Chromatiales bacterium]|jgi:MFS family permease|nr:MFS transporter [Chromatiales bacterium]MDP6150300.1 MFS transporter [Gammaproteobacteria bacterium]MDP7269972.1 MFS transporter [Gammaproteobacteria bacterium]HJP05480.1 MFS transporter [Gammaproteobacteria bacterium]